MDVWLIYTTSSLHTASIIFAHVADTTCSPTAFTCANQRCIPRNWHCDGHNDCFDGSDERACPTQVPGTCQADQFSCANHRCIPHTWRCDTDNDCGDGSDEADCSKSLDVEGSLFSVGDARLCKSVCCCSGWTRQGRVDIVLRESVCNRSNTNVCDQWHGSTKQNNQLMNCLVFDL